MCGAGSYYQRQDQGPIWAISKDKKHIAFYAQTDFSYIGDEDGNLCAGTTEWGREHC